MNHNPPKLSIVVPVYKVERFLPRCMDSLLRQTFQDFEIILVDDESPDDSAQMCDRYAALDERIKVIHKKNAGLGMARNSGMEIAQGEYIAFPDSDDYLEPETYEVAYRAAKEVEADALYYEFNTSDYPGFHSIAYPSGVYAGKEALEKVMLDMIGSEPEWDSDVKFQLSACKVIYKLDVIKKNRLQFVSERELISEDLVWNLDFLKHAACIRTIPNRFYHYCLNEASLTHTVSSDRSQRIKDFYRYVETRISDFTDKEAFKQRLVRTRLFQVRSEIESVISDTDKDFQAKRQALKAIVSNSETVRMLKEYPWQRMRLRYRVLYFLARWKAYALILWLGALKKRS